MASSSRRIKYAVEEPLGRRRVTGLQKRSGSDESSARAGSRLNASPAPKPSAIPEFSGDGRYLTHYSVHEFTKALGTPEDDVTNTFTARLLLLLESRPLVGAAVYQENIEEVVTQYWRDYGDHKTDFMPAFLANDILRFWRTFCVNYEARTERVPDKQKAKGKLKNYKLSTAGC